MRISDWSSDVCSSDLRASGAGSPPGVCSECPAHMPGTTRRFLLWKRMDSLIQSITIYALPVLFGITLHEAAHGYVARLFGDPTAYQAGRVSINPIRHIDPIGTIMVPLVLLFGSKRLGIGGLLFGGGKPVPR